MTTHAKALGGTLCGVERRRQSRTAVEPVTSERPTCGLCKRVQGAWMVEENMAMAGRILDEWAARRDAA